MIRFTLIAIFFLFLSHHSISQTFPNKDYPLLFHDVQIQKVFPDSKTFVDCIPLVSAGKIDSCYIAEKKMTGFDISDFIDTYFVKPSVDNDNFKSDTSLSIQEHIESLWPELLVEKENTKGSLLKLPYPYFVSGGRFKELHYWESYFTMLGLVQSEMIESLEQMVKNFAYLIDTFGFVPNGNRTYYLGRSQPPFFCLMVRLLSEQKGSIVWDTYLAQLEKEYEFWMNGKSELSEAIPSIKRVVLLPDGNILNRYWDDDPTPRPEAYFEDIEVARLSPQPDSTDFRNIRAACESGWDFSSRWLKDGQNISTIETTNILPVDLNSLLLNLEQTLGELYKQKENKEKSKMYLEFAKKRKKAIDNYFWKKDEGYYFDYNFVLKQQSTHKHLAGMFPLFLSFAPKSHAKDAATFLEMHFLKDGGLLTTSKTTAHQWDAPYGWAPLQYISIVGLTNYGFDELAQTIESRWIKLTSKTFKETGKLVEKYNVATPDSIDMRGKYPNQDGFGWTNGVLLRLIND